MTFGKLVIQRYLNYITVNSIQIRDFYGESEAAYAAVFHLRIEELEKKPFVITSKSKVASLEMRLVWSSTTYRLEDTLKAHGSRHITLLLGSKGESLPQALIDNKL